MLYSSKTDVCRAQVDPGPCKAALPKYFYDAADGSCKEFAYGGCQGGPNRFSTIEECEDNCKDVGPGNIIITSSFAVTGFSIFIMIGRFSLELV